MFPQVKQCAADDESKKVQVAGKDLAAFNKATRNKDAATEKAQRAEAKAAREESEKDKLKASQTRKLEQRLEAVTKVFGACSNGCKDLHACTQKVAYVMVEREAAKDASARAVEALQDKEQETAALQDAAKKAIAAFDVLKGEARALKEAAEAIAPYDDNELHAKLQELPEDSASVEAILDAERKEASRIHEDRGLQKRVEELQRKRDVLKEKVDGMQGADDARNAELSKLRGPWEKTLRDALSSLKTKFSDYMDTLGVRSRRPVV